MHKIIIFILSTILGMPCTYSMQANGPSTKRHVIFWGGKQHYWIYALLENVRTQQFIIVDISAPNKEKAQISLAREISENPQCILIEKKEKDNSRHDLMRE